MNRIAGYVSGITSQSTPAISAYGVLNSSVSPSTITGTDGNQYSLHTFTGSGSFTITTAGWFDVFLVRSAAAAPAQVAQPVEQAAAVVVVKLGNFIECICQKNHTL
jgi:hypothetical protein